MLKHRGVSQTHSNPLAGYLKAAFTYRWNLLAFFGTLGFAVLSGHGDVWIPLALAAELAYLGALTSHPRFRAAVNARRAREVRAPDAADSGEMLNRILAGLPPASLRRFEALRDRCLELRQIAFELRDPAQGGGGLPLEELQLTGLDRLLWIFLRLLFTEHSLARFLDRTSPDQIRSDIVELENRLRKTQDTPDSDQRQKIHRALEDSLQTSRDRLANYEKARANFELMQLEIERLENKIRALSEIAVNRHEPDFISSQVDQTATSMVQTERTINELQFATGLEAVDDVVPELLRRKALTGRS